MNQNRIESEARSVVRITNKDLKCKDCIYRLDDSEVLGNTSRCKLYYPRKPMMVLMGGNCSLYKKEKKSL